jgi:isopenicillin N synthase-like dioxygenase
MFDRLDFARFYSSDAAERDAFCSELVSSLKKKGFLRLINHGVPPSDIDRIFDEV